MSHETFSYRQEIYRKLLHLTSLWIPGALYLFDRSAAALLIGLAFVAVVLFEIIRRQSHALSALVNASFGFIVRETESAHSLRFTGAFYMLAAALAVCLLFPRSIAITSLCIMLIADTAAALIGRRYGFVTLLDKSLEGTTAFLITSLLIVIMLFCVFRNEPRFMVAGMISAFVATLAELISSRLHLDDNLSITLSAASTMFVIMHGL